MSDTDSSIQVLSMAREDGAPLDPPLQYARLRQEAPISWVSLWGGMATPWLVTRWEDARTVLASPGVSSQSSRPGFPTAIEDAPATPPGYFFSQDDPEFPESVPNVRDDTDDFSPLRWSAERDLEPLPDRILTVEIPVGKGLVDYDDTWRISGVLSGNGTAANLSHIRYRHQSATIPNGQSILGANPNIALRVFVQCRDMGIGQAIADGQRDRVLVLPAL